MSDQDEFSFLPEVTSSQKNKKNKKLTFNVGKVLYSLLLNPKEKTPAEMKKEAGMLVNLVKKYPNQKFWSKIEFDYRVRSLAHFFTQEGDQEVKRMYIEYNYQPTKKKEVKEIGKSGKDYNIIKKPKNIREWLQN
tara:strand:+ start:3239 stop:3643 length:405 start_codon:yes stop_codon:yes gene_type:complete